MGLFLHSSIIVDLATAEPIPSPASLPPRAAEPHAETRLWTGLLSATAFTPSTVASRADLAFSKATSPAEEIPFLADAFNDYSLRFLLIESGIEHPDSQSNMVCYGIRDEAVESAGCQRGSRYNFLRP